MSAIFRVLIITMTFLFSFQSFAKEADRSTKITVSTLNLKWFGIGGFMWNTPDQEFRKTNMKKFIDQELGDSDVIVFTEVVVTTDIEEIMREKMNCATYDAAWDRHQHVMICFDKKSLRAEKYDADYIIDGVDLGSGGLRPAAQAKICQINGKCFLQVIGVHLAAGNKSEKRTEQVKFINAELVRHNKLLPTVVTGDFNSYITAQSGLEEDDINVFENTLSSGTGKSFRSVTKHITTYGSGEWARAYDHIVTTDDIKTHSTKGYEACKAEPNFAKTFIPYGSFQKHFTDHCPVTAEISIRI